MPRSPTACCVTTASKSASAILWARISSRHSGAMQSIEPGISNFRVWSFGPSRNDSIFVIARSEATKQSSLSWYGKMDCFATFAMNGLIRRIHQLPLRARRQEFAGKDLRRRWRTGELIAFDDDADRAGQAVVLDVADADFLHL